MPAFHEVQFPPDISFGSSGGPERRTRIVSLAGGREERQTPWRHSRRRYDAGVGVRGLDDIHAIIAFFEARYGRLYGFRWKDWSDWKSCPPERVIAQTDQFLGLGDGVKKAFQIVKNYTSGGQTYTRTISKPMVGTVLAAVNGVAAPFTLDAATGLITFSTAPAAGASVTAGFKFDTPARFDTDHLEINLAGLRAGAIPSIPVVEILP